MEHVNLHVAYYDYMMAKLSKLIIINFEHSMTVFEIFRISVFVGHV